MLCVQESSFLFFLPSFYFLSFFFIPDGESCFACFPILFKSIWRLMHCVQESNLYGDSCIACKGVSFLSFLFRFACK